MKPLGFLQEDFHSEVLDFLFELVQNRDPDRKMILYNTSDRYNNKELYKKRYNIEVKELTDYIPDMVNRVCEKIFIISYDNIFHFQLLLPYKEDLIIMAHSPKHIELCKKHNINYFSLTNLLSVQFMLPLKKNITNNRIIYTDLISSHKERVKRDMNTINYIKNLQNQNCKVIMMLGSFFNNNKDIELLRQLLNTKHYILMVYTNEESKELVNLIQEYKEYVFASMNLPTLEILNDIEFFDIKYLLFAPPKNSNFYTSSWSGSIQFAFDYNLHIIIPEELANMYNMNNKGIVTFNNVNDIILKTTMDECVEYNNELQKIRDKVYDRNNIVFDVLIGLRNYQKLGDYCIEYATNSNDNIVKLDLYKNIINSLKLKIEKLQCKDILDINNNSCLFSLVMMILEKTCNVIKFVEDMELAKMYKDIFMYNNLHNRIKIYHSKIGSTNVHRNGLDYFTLDHLCYNNVGLIHIKSSDLDDILKGGEQTIIKNNPILFIENVDSTEINSVFLEKLGYQKIVFEYYTIYVMT
jgi:hypothetical protein